MATALSLEKLNYSDVQVAELTQKIREGDLTAVLRVYEEDIKQPIRSAITGTLIRSLLIQVQKVKVCIEWNLRLDMVLIGSAGRRRLCSFWHRQAASLTRADIRIRWCGTCSRDHIRLPRLDTRLLVRRAGKRLIRRAEGAGKGLACDAPRRAAPRSR